MLAWLSVYLVLESTSTKQTGDSISNLLNTIYDLGILLQTVPLCLMTSLILDKLALIH